MARGAAPAVNPPAPNARMPSAIISAEPRIGTPSTFDEPVTAVGSTTRPADRPIVAGSRSTSRHAASSASSRGRSSAMSLRSSTYQLQMSAWRAARRSILGPIDTEGWDVQARLAEIVVPTLVTCGRHDFCAPAEAEHIHAGISRSELVVFEESSHHAHLEETDRFLTVLGALPGPRRPPGPRIGVTPERAVPARPTPSGRAITASGSARALRLGPCSRALDRLVHPLVHVHARGDGSRDRRDLRLWGRRRHPGSQPGSQQAHTEAGHVARPG